MSTELHRAWSGFGTGAPAFFVDLEAHNTREWFAEHRPRYESEIAEPLRQLAEVLEGRLGTTKIFRPFRDVRFSADKRPIKEQAALLVTAPSGGLYYLQYSADGLLLGGGAYWPTKEQLATFRALLDDPVSAAVVHAEVEAVRGAGFGLMEDGRLATAPRGFAKDHPEIELLRQKSLAVARHYPAAAWQTSSKALARILEGWEPVTRWNEWLLATIGSLPVPGAERP